MNEFLTPTNLMVAAGNVCFPMFLCSDIFYKASTYQSSLAFAFGSHGQVFFETSSGQLESCMGVLFPKRKPKTGILLANTGQQITCQQPYVISRHCCLTRTRFVWHCCATVIGFFLLEPKAKSCANLRYARYQPSTSIGQAISLGALLKDLDHDFARGFLKLVKVEDWNCWLCCKFARTLALSWAEGQ